MTAATKPVTAALLALALVLSAAPKPAGAQSTVSVGLFEDPFVCDGVLRPVGIISGLTPAGPVTFSSPDQGGVFSQRVADQSGTVTIQWRCTAASTWTITVTDSTTGGSALFRITGASPGPAATPIPSPTAEQNPTPEPAATPAVAERTEEPVEPTSSPAPPTSPPPATTEPALPEDADNAEPSPAPSVQPVVDDGPDRSGSTDDDAAAADFAWQNWVLAALGGLAGLIIVVTTVQMRGRQSD